MLTKLQEELMDFVEGKGGGVSFVEFSNEFPTHFNGDRSIFHGDPSKNLLLWQGLSAEFCDAIKGLVEIGYLLYSGSALFTYIIDGCVIKAPLATQHGVKHGYKKPHWVPVTWSVPRFRRTEELKEK